MGFVLPPSPNWNCSRILDCDGTGVFCFGSKRSVYLLDFSESMNTCLVLVALHQGRVNGVSIHSKLEQEENIHRIICSGADDCSVKVTRVSHDKEHKLLYEHKRHKSSVTVVHCSPSEDGLIASGDERGLLAICNYLTNDFLFWNVRHTDSAITSLAFGPRGSGIIAIGLKAGVAMTLRYDKKSVVLVHKLREHCDEIQSLHWLQPSADANELQLLSLSQDKTVRLWNAEEGKVEKVITLEGHQKFKGKRWFALSTCAWSRECFVASNFSGELFLYDLREEAPKRLQSGEVKGHTRSVINISTWISSSGAKMALSVSTDRLIVVWNVEALKAVFSLPTPGGYVYAISQSPVSTEKFAIGVGDNTVRMFSVSNNVCSNFSTHQYKYKVTSVVWHPYNERMLAFASEEGTVGIIKDVSSKSNDNIEESATYHKRSVHSLSWGPMIGPKTKSHVHLYSVGEMVAYVHDPCLMKDQACDVKDVISRVDPRHARANTSELRFSPDFKFLALGHDDGSIDVLETGSLSLVCKIIHCRKIINNISWHPASNFDLSTCSPFCWWIAVASGSSDVYVFDLKNVIGEWTNSRSAFTLNECLTSLQGHQNRILRVAWAPGQEALLASASSDGTVQVWNVPEKRGLANYRGHLGPVVCLAWSTDGEMVFSGAEDCTLQGWRYKGLKDTAPPKEKHYKVKCLRSSQTSDERFSHDSEPLEGDEVATSDNCGTSFDDDSSSQAGDRKKEESIPESSGQKDKRVRRKFRSLFPTSSQKENGSKYENQEDCVRLASILYSGNKDEISLDDNSAHLGCFISKQANEQMIEQEVHHHKDQGNLECRVMLEVFRAADASYLRELAAQGLLNDYIVSMAFTVSPELAEEMFVAYADQLVGEKLHLKASTYLLAAGKVAEAVGLLLENKLHKEALCLARSRLNSSNPLLEACYRSASEASSQNGSFEYASKCYLALGKPKEALSMILRRSDPHALRVAASIAKETKDTDAMLAYAWSYVAELMLACDWPSAEEFLATLPAVEHLDLVVSCHKFLLSLLFKFMPEVVTYLSSCPLDINADDIPSIVITTLETCIAKWKNSSSQGKIDLSEVRKRLLVTLHTRQSSQDLQNLTVDASLCIVLFITERLMETEGDESNHWLLDAMVKLESSNSNSRPSLCFHFCSILFPNGDCDIKNLVESLKMIFSAFVENSEQIVKDYFRASDSEAEKKAATSLDVERIRSLLSRILSRDEFEGDVREPRKPITIADCIRAKCCHHALKMLLNIVASTQQHQLANISPKFDPLLKKASQLLLREGPAAVQRTSRSIEHINKLCREFIARGGCRSGSGAVPGAVSEKTENISPRRGDGGGDADANGEMKPKTLFNGELEESEGLLNLDGMTLPALAQQLQEGQQVLSTYPNFYRSFPDCHQSRQVILQISKLVTQTPDQ